MFLSAITTHTRKQFMHTSKLLKSCTPVSVLYVLYFYYSTGKHVFQKITGDNIIYVRCFFFYLCVLGGVVVGVWGCVCWGGGGLAPCAGSSR
jgi:hypothetical protein